MAAKVQDDFQRVLKREILPDEVNFLNSLCKKNNTNLKAPSRKTWRDYKKKAKTWWNEILGGCVANVNNWNVVTEDSQEVMRRLLIYDQLVGAKPFAKNTDKSGPAARVREILNSAPGEYGFSPSGDSTAAERTSDQQCSSTSNVPQEEPASSVPSVAHRIGQDNTSPEGRNTQEDVAHGDAEVSGIFDNSHFSIADNEFPVRQSTPIPVPERRTDFLQQFPETQPPAVLPLELFRLWEVTSKKKTKGESNKLYRWLGQLHSNFPKNSKALLKDPAIDELKRNVKRKLMYGFMLGKSKSKSKRKVASGKRQLLGEYVHFGLHDGACNKSPG